MTTDVDISPELEAALAQVHADIAEGRQFIEQGIDLLREGAKRLDHAGVKGKINICIEFSKDEAGVEQQPVEEDP